MSQHQQQQQRNPQQPQGKAQAQQAQEQTKTSRDPHYLQARFLAACKGKRVYVWFTGDTGPAPEGWPVSVPLALSGVLIGADQFTLAIKCDRGRVALVYKSAIAFIQREEGGEA